MRPSTEPTPTQPAGGFWQTVASAAAVAIAGLLLWWAVSAIDLTHLIPLRSDLPVHFPTLHHPAPLTAIEGMTR